VTENKELHAVITITDMNGRRMRWWFDDRVRAMWWAASWLTTWRAPVIEPNMLRYAEKERLVKIMSATRIVSYDMHTAELGECACMFTADMHNDCVRWAYSIREKLESRAFTI